MKLNATRPLLTQKRTWLIVGVTLLFAAISLWIAASVQQASVKAQVEEEYKQVKMVAKVVSATSTASQSKRLAAVNTLSNTARKDCSGKWWSSWQQALPSVKAATKDCDSKTSRLRVVSEAASSLKQYLNDDIKVGKTLEVLKISTGSEDWQKVALASAESARRDLEAVSVTKQNKELLVVSKEKLNAIVTAWTQLNDAAAKQDKNAYLKAQGELSQAYADLGAISDVSDAHVTTLVASLEAAVAKL